MRKFMFAVIACIIIAIIFYFVDIAYQMNFTNRLKALFSNKIVLTNNNIKKSKSDQRDYRMIVLKNGLRALLVSDPNTDQAAASMRVFTGSFDEPEDAKGIAHFTEHMLFLGNKKYPNSQDYRKFIDSHRGRSNAFTANDETVYYFNIINEHLFDTLDIFAEFFISPLFTADLIDKEKNAVDSEYKMHLKNDFWRRYHVDKATANSSHPYHKFSIGNLETLSNDSNATLRKKVIAFYNKYYSADNMVLTVYGSQSLDNLQQVVVDKFSNIIKRNNIKLSNDSKGRRFDRLYDDIALYDKDNLGKLIVFKTEGDKYLLDLSFPIENQTKKYREKPASYVASMLGRKDQGTLHKYLLDENWITSMFAYHNKVSEDMSVLSIEFRLTEDGVNNYQTIIEKTFAYLKVILSKGVEEWRFEEIKKILQTEFDYTENDNPINNVVSLTEDINYIDAEEILVGNRLLYDFNQEEIKNIFANLNPRNMRVTLGYKDVVTDKVEPYFKVPYRIENISDDLIDKWENINPGAYFKLRNKNQYIVKDVLPVFNTTTSNQQPKLMSQDDGIKVWCMSDLQFAKPQINISTMLITDMFSNNLENALLSKIYVMLLKEHIATKYASAIDALNLISISRNKRGLVIELKGYALGLLTELMGEINADILQFIPSDERFLAIKDKMIRVYKNNKLAPPVILSYRESLRGLEKNTSTSLKESETIQEITFTKLMEFIKTAFNSLSLESFVYGGIDCSKLSNDFAKQISKSLVVNAMKSENYTDQVINVPIGKYHQALDTKHPDYSILNIYLSSDREYSTIGKIAILAGILKTQFFEEVRTQKQLGYIVHSDHYTIDNVVGLYYLAQSPNADEQKLQKAIDTFINSSSLEILNKLTDTDLNTHKDSLIDYILKRPNNRNEVFIDKLSEILIKRYDFEKREKIAKEIRMITKDDLLEQYNDLILNPDKKRYITIHTDKSTSNIWDKMKKLEELSGY